MPGLRAEVEPPEVAEVVLGREQTGPVHGVVRVSAVDEQGVPALGVDERMMGASARDGRAGRGLLPAVLVANQVVLEAVRTVDEGRQCRRRAREGIRDGLLLPLLAHGDRFRGAVGAPDFGRVLRDLRPPMHRIEPERVLVRKVEPAPERTSPAGDNHRVILGDAPHHRLGPGGRPARRLAKVVPSQRSDVEDAEIGHGLVVREGPVQPAEDVEEALVIGARTVP